ncbi:MAG: glycosyltransferase family 4 protein [Micrococcales bacterium]|nr:glycosyltransferase family 4 protein [Micrococcales bacterium]
MHVVHLTWEYPPVVYGGLGRHVHALATAQAANGDEVTVVTQQPEGAASREELAGVEVVRVAPDGPFPYHLPSLLTWVGSLDARIGQAARAVTGADVLHAHDWVVGRAGSTAATHLGVTLIATVHATEAGRHNGWLPDDVARGVHLVEQWLVDEADGLIVCSSSMAEEVVRGHHVDRSRITVIPNGIDPAARTEPVRVPADLLDGSPRISFVGRLEWEKGVFTAVDAMPHVLRAHPQARLRMVGTGGKSHEVADRIAAAGLQSHVSLLGHVDEATLQAVYGSSDLLIAPSSYEPFGIVALEGAAAGVPLVVGDTGGLAEFVTDDRGRRCRPGDPQDLADQINAAWSDPVGTARRRDAATAALRHYRWSDIAARTDQVYRTCTRGPHPQRATAAPRHPVW